MDQNKSRGFWDRFSGVYNLLKPRDTKTYRKIALLIKKRLHPDMEVLEIAAGTGILSFELAAYCRNWKATDFSGSMVRIISSRNNRPPNLSIEVQDASDLKYPDKSFDAVVIANALHIMPDPDKALNEIRRVLRDGGILFAPTYVKSKGLKQSINNIRMKILGLNTYFRWSFESYLLFLEQHRWNVIEKESIRSRSLLAYAAAKKESIPA